MKFNPLQEISHVKHELPELISTLRKKLQGTELDYLQNVRTDDEFLAKFLRTRAYNLERAYKSVLNYYKCIHSYFADIAFDENSTSASVVPVFNAKLIQKLNITACKGSSSTIIINPGAWDTKEFTLYEYQQAGAFLGGYLTEQLETQLNGCSIIFDLQGLSFKHVRQLTPEIKRIAYAGQKGFPIRIVGIHFINYSAIFWPLYNIAKMFIKEKIRNRIHFHANMESLYEYFNKEHLPISLGGSSEDNDLTEHNAMVKQFMNRNFHCEEYFTSTDCNNNC